MGWRGEREPLARRGRRVSALSATGLGSSRARSIRVVGIFVVWSACSDPTLDAARVAVAALPSSSECPPGMVMLAGEGRIGLAPGRYAVVETRDRAEVIDPQSECAAAQAKHGDSIACWVQTDLTDPILVPRSVQVTPVCVDAWPFPGRGRAYTRDGMTAWDAQVLSAVLASGAYGGRRLCTATELQAAVAGFRSNRPFVYGDRYDPDRCQADARIGTDLQCGNPETGVYEYGAVHSHWVVADSAFVAAACEHPPCRGAGNRLLTEGMFIVLGGTGRLQTRQAPLTPHTWHDHGRPTPTGCDAMGHDDQVAICAAPDLGWGAGAEALVAAEARWQKLVDVAVASGRMDQMLDAAVGGRACPAE